MLQFNLLPDVKKEYIKAKRQKRIILSVSLMSAGVAVVIVFLLFSYVQFVQKKSIGDLTKDIKEEVAKVESVSGIDEILTIQNQLKSLPELNENRPELSRIFDYMTAATPINVFISSLEVDVVNSTMEISGTADSIASINKFVDTLKFAEYTTDEVNDGVPFTEVITQLSRNENKSSYTIEMKYDPILFNNTVKVALVIPNTVTTRSVTGQPTIDATNDLFKQQPATEEGGGQ